MNIFKTQGILLKVTKTGEGNFLYHIFLQEYGKILVSKKKGGKEKALDVGYLINCEISVQEGRDIHTIRNIKILHFFHCEGKPYSHIKHFLETMNYTYRELPVGSPHYEVYTILAEAIHKYNDFNIENILLTRLKLIQCFGYLQTKHDNITVQKILNFIHTHSYNDILRLKDIPEESQKKLEELL